MYKNAIATLFFLLVGLTAAAQWQHPARTDTSRLDVHLSTGISVTTGWGRSDALAWTAPSLSYRATDRLTLHAGFASVGSLLGSYELRGLHGRSLAPRRQGTRLVAGRVAAEYQATDRLLLWGALTRVGGYAQPLWLDGAMPVEATAFSGGLVYRTASDALFELHLHVVHDRYGTFSADPWGYPWHGGGMLYTDYRCNPWHF